MDSISYGKVCLLLLLVLRPVLWVPLLTFLPLAMCTTTIAQTTLLLGYQNSA